MSSALKNIPGFQAGAIYGFDGKAHFDQDIKMTKKQIEELSECFFHREPFQIGGKKFTVSKSSIDSVQARCQAVPACIHRTRNTYFIVVGVANTPASQISSALEKLIEDAN
jgi:hypothetical protein